MNYRIAMMNVETIRRKVTKQDVEEIARLMATRRLTETGCCLIRGIGEKQWWNWKSKGRNKEKFTDLFTRIRESKIDLLVERIENASEDADISVGDKIITKRGDWRAAAWLTEKIAPERFAQQINNKGEESKSNPILMDMMKRVFSNASEASPAHALLSDHPQTSERSEDVTISSKEYIENQNPIYSQKDNGGLTPLDNRSIERVREDRQAMDDSGNDQRVESSSAMGINPRPDGAEAKSCGGDEQGAIKANGGLPVRRIKEQGTTLPIRRVKDKV